jgi:hypothetical protein
MLDFAINHREELISTHRLFTTQNFDHCKYFLSDTYFSSYNLSIDDSNWSNTQMVSLNSNGDITGYIVVSHDRTQNQISNLGLISYKLESNPILYRDVIKFIDDLFKTSVKKIKFGAVVGSPSSIINEKLVKKYNGRVVGTYIKDVELMDGKIYDSVKFEIFNPSFFKLG